MKYEHVNGTFILTGYKKKEGEPYEDCKNS